MKVAEYQAPENVTPPAALSPSGARVSVGTGREMVLFGASSGPVAAPRGGRPIGWLDDEHLVFAEADQSGGTAAVCDLVTGAVSRIADRVSAEPLSPFFATLPNGLPR